MQSKFREGWVIPTSLILMAVIVLSDIWGIRFVTQDDSHVPLWNNIFEMGSRFAIDQGRFYFYTHGIIIQLPGLFYDTIIYDLLHTGSVALAGFLLYHVVRKYFSQSAAIIFIVFSVGFIVVIWEHSFLVAAPLFHFYTICLFSAALLVFRKYQESGRTAYLVLCAVITFIACFSQEFYQIIFLFAWVSAVYSKPHGPHPFTWHDHYRKNLALAVSLAVPMAYIALMLIWRFLHPSQGYAGSLVNLSEFNIGNFLGILFHFSISGNIFYYLIGSYRIHFVDPLSNVDVHIIPYALTTVLPALTFSSLAKATAGAAAVALALNRARVIPVARIFWGMGLSLVIMTMPSLLLGITPKYQSWYEQGVRSYTYTTLSHVGLCLLWVMMVLLIHQSLQGRMLRGIFQTGIILLTFIGAAWSDYHNHVTSQAMRDNTSRWDAMDLLHASPTIHEEIDGGVVFSPRLWSFVWSVPLWETYWTGLAEKRYGSSARFLNSLQSGIQRETLASKKIFYFDFLRLSDSRQTVVLVARLDPSRGMLTDGLWVISKQRLQNNITVQGERNPIRFHLAGVHPKREGDVFLYRLDGIQVPPHALRIEERMFWEPLNSIWPHYAFGEAIGFNRGQSARTSSYLTSGWSVFEEKHVWSVHNTSGMVLLTNQPQCSAVLMDVDLGAYYVPPQLSHQRLWVTVNDHLVAFEHIREGRTLRMAIPATVWNRRIPTSIQFIHPDARSPAEMGQSSDGRKLSILFTRLAVHDCPAPEALQTAQRPNYLFGTTLDFADKNDVGRLYHDKTLPMEERRAAVSLRTPEPSCDLKLHLGVMDDAKDEETYRVLVNGVPVGTIEGREKNVKVYDVKKSQWNGTASSRIVLEAEGQSHAAPAPLRVMKVESCLAAG